MSKASDFRWIAEGAEGAVAYWEAYSPEARVNLSCSALRLGGRLVFIDPIPLEEAALGRLLRGCVPAAVLLTNGNHERAAAEFAERFQIPVHAHVGALSELTVPIDDPFGDGAFLFGELTVIALPGGGAGESAFHWPDLGGVLVVGDALIHLPETGLVLLPEKYCLDAAALRDSVHQLPFIDSSIVLFAHGEPITEGVHERLESLA